VAGNPCLLRLSPSFQLQPPGAPLQRQNARTSHLQGAQAYSGSSKTKGSCARNSAWPSAYQEKASLNFWRPDRIQELSALRVYFRRPCSFYAANHVPWRANLQASSTILPIKSCSGVNPLGRMEDGKQRRPCPQATTTSLPVLRRLPPGRKRLPGAYEAIADCDPAC
jgi:hypothetical protein